MAEIIGPREYYVTGPWLYIRRGSIPPQLIYWGHGLRPVGPRVRKSLQQTHHWIRIELGQSGLMTLAAGPGPNGPWRFLDHRFRRTRIVHLAKGAEAQVTITPARSHSERAEGMALIARRHYLPPRHTGLFLIGRRANGTGNQPTQPIIACLTLERLTHGLPSGRRAIYQSAGLSKPTDAQRHAIGFRRKEVRQLGLAWISRIAVAEEYEGSGFASAICEVAREAAPRLMADGARWIELLRIVSGKKFAGLISGRDSDFLVAGAGHKKRTGFVLVHRELSSGPGVDMDAISGLLLPRATDETFAVMTGQGGSRIIRGDRDYMAYYYGEAKP